MRKIDTNSSVDAPNDAVVEATRKVIIATIHAKNIDDRVNIGPIIRQTLFYIYEGGERQKFLSKRPHSLKAREIRNLYNYYISKCRKHLRYDHAIPLSVIYKEVEQYISKFDSFKLFLQIHLQGVILTVDEDTRLTNAGLRMKMPWGSNKDDLLARYREVGIAFGPDDEAKLRNRI